MTDTSNVDPVDNPIFNTDPTTGKPLDMATIMQNYGQAQAQIAASSSDLAEALATGKKGIQQEQQGSAAETTAAQAINTIKGAAAAKEQADNAAASASFGTNKDAASYVIGNLAAGVLAKEQDIQQRRDMISKKLDVGITDDPLQWMINQFTVPMDVYAANVKIAGVNQDLDVIHQLEQVTREQATTNAMNDQADASVLADRQNQVLAGQAQINLGKSQQQLAALGMQGVTLKDAQTRDQLSAMWQLNNAQNESERLKISEANQPLLQAQKEELILKNQQTLADKQASDQDKALLITGLQKFGAMINQAPPSMEALKLMSPKQRDIWLNGASDPDVEQGRLPGASIGPAQAFNEANDIGARLTPGMNDVRQKLGVIIDTNKGDNALGYSQLKPAEQIQLGNAAIKQAVQNQLKNIPTNDSFYSPMSLNRMITASPALANNPIVAQLAPIAAADDTYAANPNDMIKTAMTAVGSGKMTVAEASTSIAELYQTMSQQLNGIKQYSRFGLPNLGADTGYKQSVFTGVGFGSSRVVDMTNAADVENILTRNMIMLKIPPDLGPLAPTDTLQNSLTINPKTNKKAAGAQ